MTLISLEPEFIVDFNGALHEGVVLIRGHSIEGIAKVAPPDATRVRLANKMLLPGFINVHSHALQRALRGRVEQKSTASTDDFWSWRTLMYQDACKANLDDIEAIAALAYLEMLKSGFVAVGEFNYLHHEADGTRYSDPTAISQRLMKAAESVGIRQVMLTCAYERKNHKEALLNEQRRFGFASAAEFLTHAKEVRSSVQSPLLTHGLAIHSTRACSKEMIEAICHSDLAKQGPLHVHACEIAQEVREAKAEYGCSPVEALANFGALRNNTTLIHATHLTNQDVRMIAESQSVVGLCPSTERNLGDGLCPIEDLHRAGVPLSIGTDQHVRLDPVDELRAIEEQERLRLQRRCVMAKPGHTVAESLISIGTQNGRRSLGLSSSAADFAAVALPQSYEVSGPVSALNEWLVSGTHHDVSDVFVNGVSVVSDRRPNSDTEEIAKAANEALKRLTGLLPLWKRGQIRI